MASALADVADLVQESDSKVDFVSLFQLLGLPELTEHVFVIALQCRAINYNLARTSLFSKEWRETGLVSKAWRMAVAVAFVKRKSYCLKRCKDHPLHRALLKMDNLAHEDAHFTDLEREALKAAYVVLSNLYEPQVDLEAAKVGAWKLVNIVGAGDQITLDLLCVVGCIENKIQRKDLPENLASFKQDLMNGQLKRSYPEVLMDCLKMLFTFHAFE